MDVISFLISIQDHSYFKKVTIINFSGAEVYPLLFFSTVLDTIKKSSSLSMQTIDWAHQSDAEIMSLLQTSFLGMRMAYWLGNLEELDAARKKKWRTFLDNYTGSHLILVYTHTALTNKQITAVTIPETIEKKTSFQLLGIYYPDTISRNQILIDALYARTPNLSVDQIYLFMRYAALMGKNQREFIDQWLGLLVSSEKSLFTLSQHFFAQESKKFFALWGTISADYPPAFWVVFWSEQLFRASCYVQLMQQRKIAEAKRISFRLPFSFMQRDWRLYKPHMLRDAHVAIYAIDFNIKNGASDAALDLFYSQFFQRKS